MLRLSEAVSGTSPMPIKPEGLYAPGRTVPVRHSLAERGGRDCQGPVVAPVEDAGAFNLIMSGYRAIERSALNPATPGPADPPSHLNPATPGPADPPSHLNPATPGPADPPSHLNPATPGPADPPS
jgi:hypothetical protein